MLTDEFFLGSTDFRMDLCVDTSMLAERVIVVHELSTGLLVQTGLREGNDQKALDDLKDVLEGPLGWVPVSLQRVDTDFTRVLRDVRMEYLSQEETFWCTLWEPTFNNELASENTTFVCSLY